MEDIGQNGNGKNNENHPIKRSPENNNNNLRQPPPSQPPQQCPRCASFNTKFCYYNNYSVSQPRYFCKSCRRYWTQGGTLRNVPVGGGSRKGAKQIVKSVFAAGGVSSCSSNFIGESSSSVQEQLPPPPPLTPPPPPQLPLQPLLPPQMRDFSNMGLPFPNSFYSQSGLLSALSAMQNLDRPLAFNQVPLNGGGAGAGAGAGASGTGGGAAVAGGGVGSIPSGDSANHSVLQGFSGDPTMMKPPQVLQQPIYRSQEARMETVHQPSRAVGGSWTQGFIINNPSSSNTTNVSWGQSMLIQPNNSINGPDSAISNPNQWPNDDNFVEHLPNYGPPPPPS